MYFRVNFINSLETFNYPNMNKSVYIVFFLIILIPVPVFAQNPDIEISDLVLENNQLAIYYNISKAKKKQTFEVWPEITMENGQKINASSFSGDYGKDITAGTNKKIIWDFNADGVILNGKIYVEVKATISVSATDIGLGKALLLSAIVPGLGINKLKGGGPYWLMSVPVYGLAAGSVFFNSEASNTYDYYLNNNYDNPQQASNDYQNALDNQEQSQTFAYAAIGTWALNMVWTGILAAKNKSVAYNYNKKKMFFYSGINPLNKSVGFTLKYRF